MPSFISFKSQLKMSQLQAGVVVGLGLGFSCYKGFPFLLKKPIEFRVLAAATKVTSVRYVESSKKKKKKKYDENRLSVSLPSPKSNSIEKKPNHKKPKKKEHHLWMRRDSAASGHKALALIKIISEVPSEKELVFGALDKWTAWETEFPLIAAAKALQILRQRNQWLHIIQVAKWMLSKGQGITMGTYDILLLAFDMDRRVNEAESLWNMILHTHTRSISKRLFSRMISLYDHHRMPDKIIEVFADMEELAVKPDQDTVKRVAGAFKELQQEDKQKLVLKKYLTKWKYLHFNGERVKVRRDTWAV